MTWHENETWTRARVIENWQQPDYELWFWQLRVIIILILYPVEVWSLNWEESKRRRKQKWELQICSQLGKCAVWTW